MSTQGVEELLAASKVITQPEPALRIAAALETIALEASAIRALLGRFTRVLLIEDDDV